VPKFEVTFLFRSVWMLVSKALMFLFLKTSLHMASKLYPWNLIGSDLNVTSIIFKNKG